MTKPPDTSAAPPDPTRNHSKTELRLHGHLDSQAVERLRHQIVHLKQALRVVPVRCEGITSLDPIGATTLWQLCEDARSRGVTLLLADLPLSFAWRLRRHPLLPFISFEEGLFENPLAGFLPSER